MKFFTIVKGQSERLPGKNFLDWGGVPLWRNAVEKFASYDVFVNTDSLAVLRAVEDGGLPGVHAYSRTPDHIEWELDAESRGSPVNAMLGEFLEKFVVDDDEPVVLFHVTSPFLRLETVVQAAQLLGEFESVHSVQEVQDFAWVGRSGRQRAVNFVEGVVRRTQDLEPISLSRGAFFILTKAGFRKSGGRDTFPRALFPLSPLESIEIDTRDDFEFANLVRRGLANADY